MVRRRASSESGTQRALSTAAIEHEAVTTEDARRTFQSPRGRDWVVRLHERADRDGTPVTVLRFTAADVVTELRDWPEDWRDATVEQFALMLLDAEPPRKPSSGAGPQRREDDRRDDTLQRLRPQRTRGGTEEVN